MLPATVGENGQRYRTMDRHRIISAFAKLLEEIENPNSIHDATISLKDLADVFYRLAVAYQNGEDAASETALIYVQRAIESKLSPTDRAFFNSQCGIVFWRS